MLGEGKGGEYYGREVRRKIAELVFAAILGPVLKGSVGRTWFMEVKVRLRFADRRRKLLREY